jgi:hypothetical protein
VSVAHWAFFGTKSAFSLVQAAHASAAGLNGGDGDVAGGCGAVVTGAAVPAIVPGLEPGFVPGFVPGDVAGPVEADVVAGDVGRVAGDVAIGTVAEAAVPGTLAIEGSGSVADPGIGVTDWVWTPAPLEHASSTAERVNANTAGVRWRRRRATAVLAAALPSAAVRIAGRELRGDVWSGLSRLFIDGKYVGCQRIGSFAPAIGRLPRADPWPLVAWITSEVTALAQWIAGCAAYVARQRRRHLATRGLASRRDSRSMSADAMRQRVTVLWPTTQPLHVPEMSAGWSVSTMNSPWTVSVAVAMPNWANLVADDTVNTTVAPLPSATVVALYVPRSVLA